MKRFLLAIGGCVLAVAAAQWAARAAEPAADDLQAQIEKTVARYTKAYEARDAKALALLFTPQAEYVDADGTVFHGRDAIEAEYVAAFALDRQGAVKIELTSIRPVADGVVVEEGVSTFTAPDGASSQTRYTATHVRQSDGAWLLASVRDLEPDRVSPHDRLQALGWLVGAWREEVRGSVIDTRWSWSEDGNYLLSSFSLKRAERRGLQGSHRIGWDAERKQFRSWVFDASGCAAEGWWRESADGAWSVDLSGVDLAGTRVLSTLTYSPDGKDALVVRTEGALRGGESVPDEMHRVVRQPPQPESAK
ncbi:MAG: SgcJ/EcaC family oxidoreductase [Planctomycetes bacterium]|nr:SgcJ/EcaC family oxidoreductase [Planctomycetota bacterium]